LTNQDGFINLYLRKAQQVVYILSIILHSFKNTVKYVLYFHLIVMNLLLSWNLFILAIFIVIIAYSYIIGANKTVKTIISAYLAILASDGIGNIFRDYVLFSDNFAKIVSLFNMGSPDEMLISMKVIIFATAVVILTVRGAFDVKINPNNAPGGQIFVTGVFGFLSAGLIMSTLLVYVSGSSMIQKVSLQSNIVELYTSSEFVKFMVDYYDFWFAAPVVILIAWSLLFETSSE